MNDSNQSVMVRPMGSSAEDQFELTLDVCACAGCRADGELSVILGADMQGMAADWGTVKFCSPGCAREFFSGRPLELREETEGGRSVWTGTTIVWDEPRLATVLVDGSPWAVALGHDLQAAREAVDDIMSDPPDPAESAFQQEARGAEVEVRYERLG